MAITIYLVLEKRIMMICIECQEKEVTQHTRTKLCNTCFEKRKDNKRKIGICIKCNEETHIHGKGLCSRCYKTEWSKQKRKENSLFNFSSNVRSLISHSFKRAQGNGLVKNLSTEEILGCSIETFREYIESLFQEGMSFENYGEWHLDHIKPISLAKTEEDVIVLCHYSNFQPLWAKENMSKGSKYKE